MMEEGKKILIADDSVFTRNLMRKFVLDAGVDRISEAKDGREAIDIYEKEMPDLVLMDIMMPNMNGLEALKAIREKHPDAKVIIYTASNQELVIKQALNEGALDFLPKPILREDVIAVIKRYA